MIRDGSLGVIVKSEIKHPKIKYYLVYIIFHSSLFPLLQDP